MLLILSLVGFVFCRVHQSRQGDADYYMPSVEYLNESFFGKLENYQVNATKASQNSYLWLGKVIHSTRNTYPYMCTATALKIQLFVSSANCIYHLKVPFTRVIYCNVSLPVKAFVMPNKTTKQFYDDLGIIIVEEKPAVPHWYVQEKWLEDERSDEQFEWFANYNFTHKYKAVGYATTKGIQNIPTNTNYDLYELEVILDIHLCYELLSFNYKIRGFRVPCYHVCTIKQFVNNATECEKYIGVDGGVVVDVDDNSLFGIATWANYATDNELPVGFSPVNKKDFQIAIECGVKIVNYNGQVTPETYQNLCNT